jgi:hypothetical protein
MCGQYIYRLERAFPLWALCGMLYPITSTPPVLTVSAISGRMNPTVTAKCSKNTAKVLLCLAGFDWPLSSFRQLEYFRGCFISLSQVKKVDLKESVRLQTSVKACADLTR